MREGAPRIIVVTHKPYWMPADDVYLPLQVGFGEDLGIARDTIGDNIAEKNKGYCELTALYWAWKNLDVDAVGLAHYRRHFAQAGKRSGKKERVLSGASLQALLVRHDILLPKPRRYFIETNWSHYAHAHHEKDLALLRAVLEERSPEYLPAFDRVMKRTWGHRFNMLIMKRPRLNAYCQWLFDILFAMEPRLDTQGYSAYDERVYGFLSERLLDVWLLKEGLPYGELPCLYMEEVNWPRKAFNFLKRKVMGHQ